MCKFRLQAECKQYDVSIASRRGERKNKGKKETAPNTSGSQGGEQEIHLAPRDLQLLSRPLYTHWIPW